MSALGAIRRKALTIARKTDLRSGAAALLPGKAPVGLSTLIFHSLYLDRGEIADAELAPNQNITLSDFRKILETFQSAGFEFISMSRLLEGKLLPNRAYAMLTFDDGYFNNTRGLQIIESLGIPMTIFLSPFFSLQNQLYWWDAFTIAAGAQAYREFKPQMFRLKWDDVQMMIRNRFGDRALMPTSDLNRPLSPDEVRDLSMHALVTFCNHTMHHTILNQTYSDDEVRDEVQQGEVELEKMTGPTPRAIAFPVGVFDTRIQRIMGETGYEIAFSVKAGRYRHPFPIRSAAAYQYPRNLIFSNGDPQYLSNQMRLSVCGKFRETRLTEWLRKLR
jgi:peptidoglycan/xylan/chitin deacetylase (PgdA/CDA1 family)